MSIPDFQGVMLPLSVHLSDGKEHANQETLKDLGEHFQLTDDELAQLFPSGLQAVFTNRIAWAQSHLKAAGLIESARHGYYKIRPRGLEILKSNPSRVDLRLLNQFPEYVAFRVPKDEIGKTKPDSLPQSMPETDKRTPEDQREYGYQRIRQQLASELLAKIKDSSLPGSRVTTGVQVLIRQPRGEPSSPFFLQPQSSSIPRRRQ